MSGKLKKMSLRIKLIIVICLIIFPLNILLIFFSSQSIKNVEERLNISYNNEMDVLKRRLETLESSIKTEFNGFILDYWEQFNVSSDLDGLSVIHMVDDLKIIWQKLDLMSGAYLKIRKNNAVYVNHNSASMSEQNKDIFSLQLIQTDLAGYQRQQVTIHSNDGNAYILWNCVYGSNNSMSGYDFGFFIKADTLMHAVKEAGADMREEVYLTDLSGNILVGSTGQTGNIHDITDRKSTFSMSSDTLDFKVWRLVPEELIYGTVPLAARMLQMIAIATIILIPVLWLTIRRLVLRPMNRMNYAMKEIEKDNIMYRLIPEKAGSAEFEYMETEFNQMASQIQNLRIEKYEIEIEKMEIQSINVLLQVNPHLLLNSLNMISSLAKIRDFETIQKFSISMAAYFRYALRNHDQMVALKDEMRFVKNYLDIQKVRYPNKFTCVYDIDESLDDLRIPSLLIENFVENAIKYALKMAEEIEIIIIARIEEDKLVIAIIDSGNGMDPETLQKLRQGEVIKNNTGNHIGIWNLRRRLHMLYGSDTVLNISSSQGAGTQVWIKIPYAKEGKHESADC